MASTKVTKTSDKGSKNSAKVEKVPQELPKFEDRKDLKKLSLYVTIVPRGRGDEVTKLFEKHGANFQFISFGIGTAEKSSYEVLGIDQDRDVIFSFVTSDKLDDLKNTLNNYLNNSRWTNGVGFSIPLTSVLGVSVYRFLSGMR